jgi:hypothetical protein
VLPVTDFEGWRRGPRKWSVCQLCQHFRADDVGICTITAWRFVVHCAPMEICTFGQFAIAANASNPQHLVDSPSELTKVLSTGLRNTTFLDAVEDDSFSCIGTIWQCGNRDFRAKCTARSEGCLYNTTTMKNADQQTSSLTNSE